MWEEWDIKKFGMGFNICCRLNVYKVRGLYDFLFFGSIVYLYVGFWEDLRRWVDFGCYFGELLCGFWGLKGMMLYLMEYNGCKNKFFI